MDASYFHKPWIEKLLSTFSPESVKSLPSERMHCLVAQVLKVKAITDQSDGVEISGKAELHDNHLYVNAVFTKDAVQRFEKEEGEDGFSGAEFQDLKNSIITLKKYHVISRLHLDPEKSDLLVCVEYFTLTHFDALPRVGRQPLIFACNKKNVASNILRLCRMQNESHSEPEQSSVVSSADSFSSPHLTQLLEEINKASQEERDPPRRTFVFEITVPRPIASDTGSSNGSDEDIQILNKALEEFDRKLSIAKSSHHILGPEIMAGQGSQSNDVQHFYDAPEFHIMEMSPDTTCKDGLLDGFDAADFEGCDFDISKELETNAEWRGDYVKASCTQFGSNSLELIELRGGGVSSSVEKRTDNKQTSEKPATSQAQSESSSVEKRTEDRQTSEKDTTSQTQSEVRSLDSDDWSMQSLESIGLTRDDVILANSQPDEQSNIPTVASECTKESTKHNKSGSSEEQANQSKSPQSSFKRKRISTSEETCNKIPRQESPANSRKRDKRPSVFETNETLSPIVSKSQASSQSSRFLQIRSRLIQRQSLDDNDNYVLTSTPVSGNGEGVVNRGPSESIGDAVDSANAENGNANDKSGPDLFESAQEKNSCRSEQTQPEDEPCRSDVVDKEKSHDLPVKKQQQKKVQFDDSVNEDRLTAGHDKENSRSKKCLNRTSGKEQETDTNTSKYSEDHDSSVEILNTSSGFQPTEFYTSPSSQGTSAGKKKHRPVAKLRSPQLPSSIPTPINSLPSHQPINSKSSLPLSSQSGVSSSNCTSEVPREIASTAEQLSDIKLEEELLKWCESHFLDMIQGGRA